MVGGLGKDMRSKIDLETYREMKNEAKKDVLLQLLKEVYGYTDNNNTPIDELHRLLNFPCF